MDDGVTASLNAFRQEVLRWINAGRLQRPADPTHPLYHFFQPDGTQGYLTDEAEMQRRSEDMERAMARLMPVGAPRRTDLEWEGFPDPLTKLIEKQITNPALHRDLIKRLIILRVRQIAESVSRTWLRGLVINVASPFQRTALASFLSPIYDHFEAYLRTEGLQFLSHIQPNGQYPVDMVWYKLHLFLVQNGFSIANVDAFKTHYETRWGDVFDPADLGFLTDNGVLTRMLGADGQSPESLQFSANHSKAADQAVMSLAYAKEVERNLALAMALHSRLGEGVSPYLQRILEERGLLAMVHPHGRLDTAEGRSRYGLTPP